RSPHLPASLSLDLYRANVSPAAERALRERFGEGVRLGAPYTGQREENAGVVRRPPRNEIVSILRHTPAGPALPTRPEVVAALAAIKDRPDEVSLRLALADLLDRLGDPRGEFVRVSVRYWSEAHDQHGPELEDRLGQLLEQHEADWTAPWRTGVR